MTDYSTVAKPPVWGPDRRSCRKASMLMVLLNPLYQYKRPLSVIVLTTAFLIKANERQTPRTLLLQSKRVLNESRELLKHALPVPLMNERKKQGEQIVNKLIQRKTPLSISPATFSQSSAGAHLNAQRVLTNEWSQYSGIPTMTLETRPRFDPDQSVPRE